MKLEANATARHSPFVASVTMGYGHLRAAYPLAAAFNTKVISVDAAPFAESSEITLWSWLRRMHEVLSKPIPALGILDGPTRAMMNAFTLIPSLHESRDHHEPTWPVRLLEHLVKRGLGRGMLEELCASGQPLLTTFYAPAIVADQAGLKNIYCVVTDADCNRVWAPPDAANCRIRYLVPTPRVVRRLRSFGVPDANIQLTGFPLPTSLTSNFKNEGVRIRFAQRLARLDPSGAFRSVYADELAALLPESSTAVQPGPLVLMFAVGGAGAQSDLPSQFLPSLRSKILSGELQVQLVAGTRREVRQAFVSAVERSGLSHVLGKKIELIYGENFDDYYTALNAALLRTDILWTKPSEMSFYPALGLPCIIAPPVGDHERYNRSWLREQGVGLKQRPPKQALGWLTEWLEDGTLAGAAWSGFTRLPKHGTQLVQTAVNAGAIESAAAHCFLH